MGTPAGSRLGVLRGDLILEQLRNPPSDDGADVLLLALAAVYASGSSWSNMYGIIS